MNLAEEKAEAIEVMKCTFASFDMIRLAETVKVEFNGRFTARMGDASHWRKLIRLSSPLWERAIEKERFETVVHETCHIIAIEKHGMVAKGHGLYWKEIMFECGVTPERYHTVSNEGLRQKVPAQCGCSKRMIGKIRANRIRTEERSYFCRKCDTNITLV